MPFINVIESLMLSKKLYFLISEYNTLLFWIQIAFFNFFNCNEINVFEFLKGLF